MTLTEANELPTTEAEPSQERPIRPFFILWTGQSLSLIGSQAVQFALIWWLTETSGSATILATATRAGSDGNRGQSVRGLTQSKLLLCATSVFSVSPWRTCLEKYLPQRHREHRGCTEKSTCKFCMRLAFNDLVVL